MTDTERIDWMERMMTPDANYCEIFFAGLRNWTRSAFAFQIESNPERFQTMSRPTLREAMDAAMQESNSNAALTGGEAVPSNGVVGGKVER